MKALVLRGPNDLRIDDVEVPKLQKQDILIKMMACGVCGTDVEKVHGRSLTPPVLGHEVAGVVEDVGPDAHGFRKGDPVFVHHHTSCYSCYYCRRGDYTMCDKFQETNLEPGGFAEYAKLPSWNVEHGGVWRLPESLSFVESVFVEPMGCCLRALAKASVRSGDDVLVCGVGPAGILHVLLLPSFGAGRVIVSDLSDFRLRMAEALGAYRTINPKAEDMVASVRQMTDGRGADLAILAVGHPSVFSQALGAVRKGGRILLFGAPPRGSQLTLDTGRLFINEITVMSSYSTSEAEMQSAAELLARGAVDVKALITHRFPLEQAPQALRLATEAKESMKIVVESGG